MAKEKEVIIQKLESVFHDKDCTFIPTNFERFKEFWMSVADRVPREFRHTTEVYIEPHTDYGAAVLNIQVVYSRPETFQEKTNR